MVAELLPALVATGDRFHALVQSNIAYQDLLNQVDELIAGVVFFAGDELLALAPSVLSGARQFEESDSRGFTAYSYLIHLDIINDHPELLTLAARRARAELWQALHDGTLPARFKHDQPVIAEQEVETPAE